MRRRLAFLMLFLAATIYGQNSTSHFIKRPAFETGAIFQRWTTTEDRQLDEIVVPLMVHYPVSERFSVSALNTPTSARLRGADTSFSLTAFTDTKISVAWILGEERALLNFGVSAPSGPTALDARKTRVAQEITSHALAMPTSYFGGGLDVSASIAAAAEWGSWIFGGSLSGVYKGRFAPTAGSPKYLPGPEIGVSFGFDRPWSESNRVFGDIGYTWYGADKVDSAKVFQSDGKVNFSLAAILASERWQASFFLENRLKRKSPFAFDSTYSVSYGNELDFSAELARQMNRDAALLASALLRIYGKNNTGSGEAVVISFGPGWRGMILPALQMEVAAHFAIGKLEGSRILGGGAKAGFRYQF